MWYVDQKHNLAVAQIPRAGLNTIAEWLRPDAVVVANDATVLSSIKTKIAFVRDPFDRLMSAFSLFFWMSADGKQKHSSGAPGSWPAFIDHVLSDIADDEHWRPQAEHIGQVSNVVMHRFESINETFQFYRPGILPHKGRTSRAPGICDYRVNDILEKYLPDFQLRMRAR